MPALLRGEHQREGRIARDVDMRDRIHLDGDSEGHVRLLPLAVTPAEAGVSVARALRVNREMPACAGMTVGAKRI
ncbi:hypothetical protein GCM10008023_16630 [Sphingomonas glacialis]|uniref:Uncharacterized protein n=1 Tax=Sphingomonas glacialis TaxID=658225 RepID=A0ABQ3LFG3_9SPHN|nr:hypothetical protein GCM10008023_16630 [Sphingomonas glacialis]